MESFIQSLPDTLELICSVCKICLSFLNIRNNIKEIRNQQKE